MAGFTAFNAKSSAPATANPPTPQPDIPQEILSAFAGDAQLQKSILQYLNTSPHGLPIFSRVATYIHKIRSETAPRIEPEAPGIPTHNGKKRKLETGTSLVDTTTTSARWADRSSRPDYNIPESSFSMPMRKKARLECLSGTNGGYRGVSAAGETEFGMSWDQIECAFCLPVPEKMRKQYNFVLLPKVSAGAPVTGISQEPVLWTMDHGSGQAEDGSEEEPSRTTRYLNSQLSAFRKEVLVPDEREFKSAMPNPRKDAGPSYHVKAHRGSKEGYLFFLAHGIFWGFKKPLLFMPFSAITSIAYSSVLQRTFNINVTLSMPSSAMDGKSDGSEMVEQEVEFGMIDQVDFAGIDAYIKGHGLNDASLAEQRRAKVYGVNQPRKGKSDGNGVDASGAQGENGNGIYGDDGDGLLDGETELQRAERLLQDAEDDEEEDYVEEDEDSEAGSSEDEEYGEDTIGDDGGGEHYGEEDEGAEGEEE